MAASSDNRGMSKLSSLLPPKEKWANREAYAAAKKVVGAAKAKFGKHWGAVWLRDRPTEDSPSPLEQFQDAAETDGDFEHESGCLLEQIHEAAHTAPDADQLIDLLRNHALRPCNIYVTEPGAGRAALKTLKVRLTEKSKISVTLGEVRVSAPGQKQQLTFELSDLLRFEYTPSTWDEEIADVAIKPGRR
jgi:hypothetical protein